MALAAATVTKITRRHGYKYIAQLTRDKTSTGYIDGDATHGTVEEDVLETAVLQAQEAVRQKIGAVDEDHWAVVDIIPYFLEPPGDNLGQLAFDRTMNRLVSQPGTSQTTAIEKGEDDDRRRYDGADFEDDADLQAPSRPRRSTF